MKSIISDDRRFRERRGMGEGKDYIPWIQATDFSSLGLKWRIPGVLIDRLHHFLSLLEERVFYIFESMDVVDIREQFPLFPLEETIEIAKSIGVRHPRDRGKFSVRTTDLLITTKNGFVAVCVKYKKDLRKKRVREKLAIEEKYWERRRVKFLIITEEDITRYGYRNAERIRGFGDRPLSEISDEEFIRFAQKYKDDKHMEIKELFSVMSDELNESYAVIHSLFLHLIFKRRISFDFNVGYVYNLRVTDFLL